jgi:hypothetical protein
MRLRRSHVGLPGLPRRNFSSTEYEVVSHHATVDTTSGRFLLPWTNLAVPDTLEVGYPASAIGPVWGENPKIRNRRIWRLQLDERPLYKRVAP